MLSGNDIMRMMAKGAEEGLSRSAHQILAGATHDAPPTDPADDPSPESLRESGQVVPLGGLGFRVQFTVPWAARQHEHRHHPHGGTAKFLERNAKARIPSVPGSVAAGVRSHLGRG